MSEVRVFWCIATPREDGSPVCVGEEFTLAPAGTPCGSTWIEAPAWGKYGEGGFCYWAKDEAALAERGYAPDPDGAWELAEAEARHACFDAYETAQKAKAALSRILQARAAAKGGPK